MDDLANITRAVNDLTWAILIGFIALLGFVCMFLHDGFGRIVKAIEAEKGDTK
jgi:hypothetical protein